MTDFVGDFVAPPTPDPIQPSPLDPIALVLSEGVRDSIWQAYASAPRSVQVTAGASEIGSPCARQTAYRTLEVPAVNFPDPWRAVVGSGIHLQMADYFRRINGASGRYLVEHPITFEGVPGTVDLFDRRRKTLIDWKFPRAKTIADARRNGPPAKYVVQLNIYAGGLRAQGEDVERVALAYIPADGLLSDIHVWHSGTDPDMALSAIAANRANAELATHSGPGAVPPTPSRLCPWCAHYRPNVANNLDVSCPGNTLSDVRTKR